MADHEDRPVREVGHAELLKMVGRRAIRRRPSFGLADRKAAAPREESMEPHRGRTPAINGRGPKLYVHFGLERVSYARWTDDPERIAVTRFTYPEWAVFCQDQGRAVWKP